MAPANMSEFLASPFCAASAAPAASNASNASSSSSCGPVPLASVSSLVGLTENSVNRLYWLGVLACLGYLLVYLVTIITKYRLKMKEMEFGVFLAAAQSDEQTLRLSYLLRQTHDSPLLLVYKSRNAGDAIGNVTGEVTGDEKILLVRIPVGGKKPPSLNVENEGPQGQ